MKMPQQSHAIMAERGHLPVAYLLEAVVQIQAVQFHAKRAIILVATEEAFLLHNHAVA